MYQRQGPTHELHLYGEQVTGTDELGNALTDTDASLGTWRVRYYAAGEGFMRDETGEEVHSSPTARCPPPINDVVEAGQEVELIGIRSNENLGRFTIQRVAPKFDQWGTVETVTLVLSKDLDA